MAADDLSRGMMEVARRLSEVQGERDALRAILVKLTNAVSISQFHALLCEAKELLSASGVKETGHGG